MFDSIKLLRERIGLNNRLEVVYADYVWTASFRWNPPLGDKTDELVSDLHLSLPIDYVTFLKEFANGCLLYHDLDEGQWGYAIYSLQQVVDMRSTWQEILDIRQQDGYVVFAELHGEAGVLLFDINQPSDDRLGCTVKVMDPMNYDKEGKKLSQSFHEWLDHIITAQGDQYWEWY
jgi:hypothetical protein